MGISPGEGSGNSPQYTCLKNPTNRGAWQATFYGVAKRQTWLRNSQISLHRDINKLHLNSLFESRIMKWSESHSVMSDSLQLHGLHSVRNSLGQNTGVGSLSLLQGIFPNQGSNPGLPYWRQILYQLNHQGSPRILDQVAYPFSRGSSWPRNWTRVSCIAGGFFLLTVLFWEQDINRWKQATQRKTTSF